MAQEIVTQLTAIATELARIVQAPGGWLLLVILIFVVAASLYTGFEKYPAPTITMHPEVLADAEKERLRETVLDYTTRTITTRRAGR